jgi:hypothetical protein
VEGRTGGNGAAEEVRWRSLPDRIKPVSTWEMRGMVTTIYLLVPVFGTTTITMVLKTPKMIESNDEAELKQFCITKLTDEDFWIYPERRRRKGKEREKG